MNPVILFHIFSGTATILSAIILFLKPIPRNSRILNLSSVITAATGVYAGIAFSMPFNEFCSKMGLYLVVVVSSQIYFLLKFNKKLSLND